MKKTSVKNLNELFNINGPDCVWIDDSIDEENPCYSFWRGKKMKDDQKNKISKAMKGKPKSEEWKEKMRGRVVSDETKLKMSMSSKGKNKGRTLSEEHKQKIRDAASKRNRIGGKFV